MKTQEFKTSKGEFIGVLVPDDSCWFGITTPQGISNSILNYNIGKLKFIRDYIPLPNGQYKIIGIQTEITEEQAKEIVDELAELIFKDYIPQTNGLGMSCFDTALESFNSLMQKLEIKPDTKTLIIQKIK